LIVGLGNPGTSYARTWHNAGFLLLDLVCKNLNLSDWKSWRSVCECLTAEIKGDKVLFLKPTEFMNNSGRVLEQFMHFYKIKPSQILVCYDDVSLDLGTLRIRKKGSAGGHNGIKDIIACLGTDEFLRLKIGIGTAPCASDCRKYVLSKIPKAKKNIFDETLNKASDAVLTVLNEGIEPAMNRFNCR